MVVKFYLSKDKRASEPQKGCLVICSVSWYGHRLKRSTGENCPEKEWLGNKGNIIMLSTKDLANL